MGAHAHETGHGRLLRTDYAKWLLVVGFLALGGALASAHAAPATGYELSIYAGTPLAFWSGAGLAVVVAVVALLVLDAAGWVRGAAFLLAYLTGFAVWALPVVRGYYFFGSGDALSHFGYATSIAAGDLSTLDLLYPGLHTTGLAVAAVTGVRLQMGFELAVVAFLLAFLVFVPLCVRAVADGRTAVAVGAIAALLVLPVNNVSVHPVAHPTTQAILLVPALLYLLFRYTTAPTGNRAAAPYAVLLLLVGGALVLVHPQQALNAVLLVGAISATQIVVRRVRPEHRIASHRLVLGPTVLLAALWLGWSAPHERVSGSVEGVIAALSGGAVPADEAAQRAGSLVALGGSISELFVKLFAVSLLFAAVTGVVALLAWRRSFGARSERETLRAYLGVALVPLSALFVVFFAASVTTQYFRHLGFLMVLGTVVGAAGFTDAGKWLSDRVSPGVARTALAVVLLACIAVQAPAMYASPYMYQDNAQVTEMRWTGYTNTFETRDPAVPFTGIRSGPNRYVDAYYGPTSAASATFPGKEVVIPPPAFGSDLAVAYASPHYLPVTRADYLRELRLYEGFRYGEAGFTALRSTPGVARVRTNGEYRLYLLSGSGA